MSLFAKAPKIETKSTAKAKNAKTEIALAGVQSLAEIQAMIKNLTAVARTLETSVKEAGFEEFLKMETKVRPESFKGIEGLATCSVEMRKRGTNSALNADELEVLEGLGLQAKKEIVTVGMFGINPDFAADEKLMEKVSKALEKIVPEGFIVQQEEVSKMVVDEELLNKAFAMEHGSDDRKTALTLCTTMALKPALTEAYDLAKLGEQVAKLLTPEEDDVIADLESEGAKLIAQPETKAAPAKRVRKAAVAVAE